MNAMTKFTEEYAAREDLARHSFIECVMRSGDLSKDDATKAFKALWKAKAMKYDGYMGVYSVKHGALMGREVLRRAAGLEG